MKKEICVLLLGACLVAPVLAQDDDKGLTDSTFAFTQSGLQASGFDSQMGGLDRQASDDWLDPKENPEDVKSATPSATAEEPALNSSDEEEGNTTDEEGQDRVDAIKGKKGKKARKAEGVEEQLKALHVNDGETILIPVQPSKSTIAVNSEDFYGTSEEAKTTVFGDK